MSRLHQELFEVRPNYKEFMADLDERVHLKCYVQGRQDMYLYAKCMLNKRETIDYELITLDRKLDWINNDFNKCQAEAKGNVRTIKECNHRKETFIDNSAANFIQNLRKIGTDQQTEIVPQ